LVLRGTSSNFPSSGSLGNLGDTDVDKDDIVTLPHAIRSHERPLLLDPIPLSPAARARHPNLDAVGGLAGYTVALMENDHASDADAEAAHEEFNVSMRGTVKDAIDEFVVPSVIPQPTADDIKTLFRDSLGPRIAELVQERRNRWAKFSNYENPDDKVGVDTAFFIPQDFAGGVRRSASALFAGNGHGTFSLAGMALGVEALPNPEVTLERTLEVGAPTAEGSPSAVAIQATTHIVYRDGDGRIRDLFRDANGQVAVIDLTQITGAYPAKGNPFAHVETPNNFLNVLYRGTDDHVHGIYWGPGTSVAGHEDVTRLAGITTRTDCDPVVYLDSSNVGHVIFRGSNGELHELFSPIGGGPVGYANLTRAARRNPASMSPPSALGNPSAYFSGTNIVIFHGDDGHIWALHWDDNGVFAEDISGFTNSPLAAGDPCAVYIPALDLNQIVYRTAAGELIELFWQGVTAATGWSISQAAAPSVPGGTVPLSQVDPVLFHNPATNTKHVIYQANGYVMELSWTLGTLSPRFKNLTIAGVATVLAKAVTRPAAFVAGATVHVPFRGADNHVYEIVR
jgi:hypothetical protein